MGSWNATCGITQLPITEGARVVLFPLVIKQQDFMARDALTGSASVGNDLIAQPVALPIYGTYDGGGGVDVEKGDLGLGFLAELLQHLAGKGELLREKSAHPVALKKLPKDFFSELLQGRLLITVPNIRKQWLVDLKKTIAEHGDGSGAGFEHYQAQLKVDPATMPDTLQFALGAMMVPQELYEDLGNSVGQAPAYGYFDEAAGKLVTFKGTRQAELHDFATAKPAQRAKVATALAQFEAGLAAGELTKAQVDMVREMLPIGCVPRALKQQEEILFYSRAGKAALMASAMSDDLAARTLWVQFMLFSTAMHTLRKQWTVQAGGGSSYGLDEGGAALYQVTATFMNKALADFTQSEAETADQD